MALCCLSLPCFLISTTDSDWISNDSFAAIACISAICLAFLPLEIGFDNIDHSALLGALLFFFGAATSLLCKENASASSLFASLIFSTGLMVLFYVRFLLGPLQDIIMFGCLSVWANWGVYVAALRYRGDDLSPPALLNMSTSARMLALTGLVLGCHMQRKKIRPPWHEPPNITMYAYVLLILVLVLQEMFDVLVIREGNSGSKAYHAMAMANVLMPLCCGMMMLQIYRASSDLEGCVDHCSTLTEQVLTTATSLLIATVSSSVYAVGSFIESVCVVFELDAGAITSAGLVTTTGFVGLATSICIGRGIPWKLPLFAKVCLAICRFLNAINYSLDDSFVQLFSCILGCVGSSAMIGLNLMHSTQIASVTWRPLSWRHALHPANYIYLVGLLCLAGSFLSAWKDTQAGSCAFWMLSSHVMSLYVAESCRTRRLRHNITELKMQESQGAVHQAENAIYPDQSFDVLICGGSISGLLMACQLGRAEVKALVVDLKTSTSTDARFVGLNPASRAILHRTLDPDLILELEQLAVPSSIPFGARYLNGVFQQDAKVCMSSVTFPLEKYTDKVSLLDSRTESQSFNCRFARFISLRVMQAFQETVLLKQAQRHPIVDIRYGWKMLTFAETSAGTSNQILSDLRSLEGDEKMTACSHYIVGADGPSSTVAKLIGTRFDGYANMSRPRNTLLRSEALFRIVENKFGLCHQLQIARLGVGMMILVLVDVSQSMFNVGMYHLIRPDEHPDWKAAECMAAILGSTDFDILQESHYYWNLFIANSFSSGRAFLIGDAAHSWPPIGGLGGNSAYGDAKNLGWKIINSCKGRAGRVLLESYDMERRQIITDTGLFVLNGAINLGSPEKAVKIAASPIMRFWIMRFISRNIWLRLNRGKHANQHFAQDGIQFGLKLLCSPIISTSSGSLVNDPPSRYTPCIATGAYLPDYRLGEQSFVHDHIHRHLYSIVVIGDEDAHADTVRHLTTAFSLRDFGFHVAYISLFPADGMHSCSSAEVLDLYSAASILIVRPDFYVAWKMNSRSKSPTREQVSTVITTLTGLTSNGDDNWDMLSCSDEYLKSSSFLERLRTTFSNNTIPLRINFPNAVACKGALKSDVVAQIRKKNDTTFKTDTRVDKLSV